MKQVHEIREGFSPKGHLESVDAYMLDCMEMALTGDPDLLSHPECEVVQASVSLAVQRILHWAWRHRNQMPDPDDIPTHAIIGVFGGIGLAQVGLGYNAEEVARKGVDVVIRAAEAAEAWGGREQGEADA